VTTKNEHQPHAKGARIPTLWRSFKTNREPLPGTGGSRLSGLSDARCGRRRSVWQQEWKLPTWRADKSHDGRRPLHQFAGEGRSRSLTHDCQTRPCSQLFDCEPDLCDARQAMVRYLERWSAGVRTPAGHGRSDRQGLGSSRPTIPCKIRDRGISTGRDAGCVPSKQHGHQPQFPAHELAGYHLIILATDNAYSRK
jgi:hypothetical protein